jgi:hypothetical protein
VILETNEIQGESQRISTTKVARPLRMGFIFLDNLPKIIPSEFREPHASPRQFAPAELVL